MAGVPVPLRRPRLPDLPAIAGGVSAATGLIALVGWTFHATLMTTVVPRAVAMKPNTALALVLIGVGLAIISGRSVGARRRRIGVGLVLAAIGLVTALEYVTGRSLGIDEILFRGFLADAGGPPGRQLLALLAGQKKGSGGRGAAGGRHFSGGFFGEAELVAGA